MASSSIAEDQLRAHLLDAFPGLDITVINSIASSHAQRLQSSRLQSSASSSNITINDDDVDFALSDQDFATIQQSQHPGNSNSSQRAPNCTILFP